MTTDKARKRATRTRARELGVSYTTAHRQLTEEPTPAHASGTTRRPFVLAVTAPKGGTGKTSLSVNLAVAAARHLNATRPAHDHQPEQLDGRPGTATASLPRVLLIDASVQQGDVGTHLGRHTPTAEALIGTGFRDNYQARIDAIDLTALASALVVDPDLGIAALLAPTDPADRNPLLYRGRLYAAVAAAAAEHFDVIVVDTPSGEFYHDMFRDFIFPVADRIAVLVDGQRGSAVNANAWLEVLSGGDDYAVPRDRVGVLLNRLDEAAGTPETVAAWPHLGTVSHSAAFAAADRSGGVAVNATADGGTALAEQLDRVWQTVLADR